MSIKVKDEGSDFMLQDLLFSYLELPRLDVEPILQEILTTPGENWFFDEYRQTWMLPLFTEMGQTSKAGIVNRGGPLAWTPSAPASLKLYFEEHIFPIFHPHGRVMVLRTDPGAHNAEHIDCTKEVFSKEQPKLRIVLQGDVSSLYFVTQQGHIRPPAHGEDGVGRPFIMDGRWPHGMKNNYPLAKYTVCLGAPWQGEGLHRGLFSNHAPQVSSQKFDLPDELESYFESPHARRLKLLHEKSSYIR